MTNKEKEVGNNYEDNKRKTKLKEPKKYEAKIPLT
jgi:hypothetical protein